VELEEKSCQNHIYGNKSEGVRDLSVRILNKLPQRSGKPFDGWGSHYALLRQPHFPHQLSKPRVGAYGVELEVSFQAR
jgi:hypothetical protein